MMNVLNLTGNNSAAVNFRVDVKDNGAVALCLTFGKLANPVPAGVAVIGNHEVTETFEIHMDKPESIGAVIQTLQRGYAALSVEVAKGSIKARQKEALGEEITKMAAALTQLQSRYDAM